MVSLRLPPAAPIMPRNMVVGVMERTSSHRRIVLSAAIGLFAALVFTASGLRAETGGSVTLPTRIPANGLVMEVDSRWVLGSGYHPVKVTIAVTPAAPSMRQRSFRIELRMHATVQKEPTLVSQFLEIEQGAASGTATILVPQTDAWTSAEVSVYEDGSYLSELSGLISLQQASANDVSESRPAALFIHSAAPRLDERSLWVAESQTGQRPNEEIFPLVSEFTALRYRRGTSMNRKRLLDSQIVGRLTNEKRGSLLPASALPDNWLAYTGLDVVFCTLDEWQNVKRNDPSKWQVIRQWVRAGGNLILVDQDMMGRTKEISPSIDGGNAALEIQRVINNGSLALNVPGYTPPELGTALPGKSNDPARISRLWTIQVGMGQVVAVEGDLSQFRATAYQQILNTMTSLRWSWFQRHGISNLRFAGDYDYYRIPGVGDPPLLTFLGSITLFVIVIGPVNYLLLRRWRRLYLLLVTVPAGAALVTGSIFLVALVADGLGTRVTVRSCTALDQVNGEYSTWSRQAYYAGMKPSKGLRFSGETAVYPILNPSVNLSQESRRDPRKLHWENGQQLLTEGYLKSRRMEQFLVIQAQQTKATLDIVTNDSGISATNNLGAAIDAVVVRDESGNLFLAEGIGQQSTVNLAPTDVSQALNVLRKLIADRNPRGQETNRFRRFDYQYERWQYEQMDSDTTGVDFPSSRLEQMISAAVTLPPPGSYFAVTHSCPWVEIGAKAELVESGFHLVRARWK